MPEYKYLRTKQWFYSIPSGQPGEIVAARYRGTDELGQPDPKAGGPNGPVPGKTYNVILMSNSNKVMAPCPDFCNGGENPRINAIDRAIINTIKSITGSTSGKGKVAAKKKAAVKSKSKDPKKG
jgi:hypothetical protein